MTHHRKISVIGLGYVGLPVAVTFGRIDRVVGFDISPAHIDGLRKGHDRTGEIEPGELATTDVLFTNNPKDLTGADFHIIAVPTPIDTGKQPNLDPLTRASITVGEQLTPGDIVVYESTVYPGVTEEICIPLLEQASNLRSGIDFHVGYSPERINPGDKERGFANVKKVISAEDPGVLDIIADVYESVVTAGIHRASGIKVAEAAKVIENTQRDLNVALMNELSIIFDRLGIDTGDVLAAAGTKWNFLPFAPGLVGGHCIGVDPYYLTHKATTLGYHPQVILAGRRINDEMGRFVASRTVKELIRRGQSVKGNIVTVLGLTFKENVPDLRNTRVVDIVHELTDYGIHVQVHDPLVDPDKAYAAYRIALTADEDLRPANAVVLAVAHREYVTKGWSLIRSLLTKQGVVMDIKGVLDRSAVPSDVTLWRL
uniref:UDP-N-acetyl-D-galactosamine dehydrogenase n=1 Tax=Candidatus Kentrum sp. TUN TaxID=2126343 RepID=A0A450ZES7_9GAMM|nr:MAG: UDP-N-acetyl-D-galactosamine dehydrogenase [Candidatus Kentron sp. TUN]VFK52476.1 MAG: UDP-N-acetyl-D-galactosamine dehydrogenase [Candidatus Kentron sp. TUN]